MSNRQPPESLKESSGQCSYSMDMHRRSICLLQGRFNSVFHQDCNGCISVRSCRSAAAAHACNHSANAEHLVPRVRPGPLDHKLKESWRTPTHHEQTGTLRTSDFAQLRKHVRCKNVQRCRIMKYSTNAGSGSGGFISVRSCFSAASAAFRECGASGSASAARTSGP